MSSNEDEIPIVTPEDVQEEKNLLRNIQNALGIAKKDPGYDDNALAAVVANTARANMLLGQLAGQDFDIEPDISLAPNIDLSESALEAAIEEAQAGVNRVHIYDATVNGSGDNILTQSLTPMTESSYFRITVQLDTATTFSLRVLPDSDDDPDTTSDFNEGDNLSAGARYEFTTDVNPDADYNFRAGAAATVDVLRVQELILE